MSASPIRIEYAGRLALTVQQAAARYGLSHDAMRQALKRLQDKGAIKPLREQVDGRTPLYDAAKLDTVMQARPGKGVNLRAENRRPRAAA